MALSSQYLLLCKSFSGGFGGSNAKKTTPSQFMSYLEQGDVKKVEIVNRREAKVYLTKEALEKEAHKGSKTNSIIPSVSAMPNYSFEFGDLQNFENEVNELIRKDNLETELIYETQTNVWGDLLLTLLPFVLIIGVWIFIMRRMSSGAGGGAGGQIFNIGKSKAKLF